MAFTGLSINYGTLLGAALLSGLGVAAYHPEGSKFARYASGTRKGTGMALFSVGGNLGFAAGPVLAGLLYGLAGLHGSLGFLAISGAMALLLWAGLPTITAEEDSGGAARSQAAGGVRPGARAMIPVVLLVLVVIMRSWVHMGLVTFLPQYYVHYLHQGEAYAAAVTSIFLFGGVFGTLAGGPAADRWGLKSVIIASMILTIPLLLLFNHLSGIWVTVAAALAGFAVISTFSVTVVLGQEMLPNNVGLASGLMLGFGIGMGGVGTTLLGWVADHRGLPAVFETMIIFPVLGLILSLFLPGSGQLARRAAGSRQEN
jgi:FSR family fosmidomycin resistance protein-like MFS transporter